MCTSLTFRSENGDYFLARTMDFAFELEGRPVIIPRDYSLNFALTDPIKTRYGFVGSGRNIGEYLMADGVNEQGLAMAELYFLDEAVYDKEPTAGKINLAPQELIMWVLGTCDSVAAVRERIGEVRLIERALDLLGKVVPLHFIVADKQGDSAIIETNRGYIEVKDNPVGVMANGPELEWHLKNLNNYLALQPTNFPNKQVGDQVLKPFGQGSGTFGLPGGYTSPERFVRTAFQRHYALQGKDTQETVHAIFQLLNGVTIPKGVNIKDDGTHDYTQYRAVFNVSQGQYYIQPYGSATVYGVAMSEAALSADHIQELAIGHRFEAEMLS